MVANNRFQFERGDRDDPGYSAFAVTPHNTTEFTVVARALYVGTTGNVVVIFPDDSAITFTAVPAGALLPVICKRVHSTGTTASNIVALV